MCDGEKIFISQAYLVRSQISIIIIIIIIIIAVIIVMIIVVTVIYAAYFHGNDKNKNESPFISSVRQSRYCYSTSN
jgi:flagellar basal body-associated protein FliL